MSSPFHSGQAVLAHELGHLKCDHGLWLTVANVLASGTVSVLPVVTGMVQEALLRWLRAGELTCDRAALLVAQVRDVMRVYLGLNPVCVIYISSDRARRWQRPAAQPQQKNRISNLPFEGSGCGGPRFPQRLHCQSLCKGHAA